MISIAVPVLLAALLLGSCGNPGSAAEAASQADQTELLDAEDAADAEAGAENLAAFKATVLSSVVQSALPLDALPVNLVTPWNPGGAATPASLTLQQWSVFGGVAAGSRPVEIARMQADTDPSRYSRYKAPITAQELMRSEAAEEKFLASFVPAAPPPPGPLGSAIPDLVGNLLDTYGLSSIDLSLPLSISVISVPPPLPTLTANGSVITGSFPFQLGHDAKGTPLWCVLSFKDLDLNNTTLFGIRNVSLQVFSPLLVNGFLVASRITLSMTGTSVFTLTGDLESATSRLATKDGKYYAYELDSLSGFLRIDVDAAARTLTHYEFGIAGRFSIGTSGTFWHLPGNPAVDHLRINVMQAELSDGILDLRVRLKEPRAGRSSQVEDSFTADSVFSPILCLLQVTTVCKELSGKELDTVQGLTFLMGVGWVVPVCLTMQGQIDHWQDPSKDVNDIIIGNFVVAYGNYFSNLALPYETQFRGERIGDYDMRLSALVAR